MSELIRKSDAIETVEFYEGFYDPYPRVIYAVKDLEPVNQWTRCSERLPDDGVYLVYAPNYTGGSSSAKECHNGVMFSRIKNGKWSIEHGYHKRPGCVWAWMTIPKYEGKKR